MQFRIEDSFWSLFPDVVIGIVVVRGLDNTGDPAMLTAALLADRARGAVVRIDDGDITLHPAIAPWRAAYAAFGVKPNKFRSSIESLLRSARNGNVRSINPLVDIYNAVSLKYFLPCGGEDLARVEGDIRLTRAEGGEHFVPLGSEEEQPPIAGEVIYRDDVGVICRSWNWREAERTKLTETTEDVFLCIEALTELGVGRLSDACEELASMVKSMLGGEAQVHILDRVHPRVELS
ncbi:MAG: phenylalanine--tRNA ligase beta subunit-related protein [Chloroflexia bacterium]